MPPGFTQRAWQGAWPALFFCAVALVLFAPALNRVFVADQIWYFAELNGRSSLLEGLRHHDYAATRRYWKGDDSLYRPLLFVWLAFANWLFSYHHAWWNAANVVLHGLVVLCLFRLLLTIRSSRFAFGAALLFLVMKPSMELVVWHHLGGYLLACIFLMIGVRAFVQLTGRQERSPSLSVLVTYALAFTTASLFYEAMAVVALLAGGIILLREWRQWSQPGRGVLIAVSVPIAVFSFVYVLHVLRVERFSYVDRPIAADSLVAIWNAPEVIGRWTLEVMVPPAVDLLPIPFARLAKNVALRLDPASILAVVLGSILIVLLGLSVRRRRAPLNWPLLALLFGAILIYTSIICVGRARQELLSVTYYLYIFCLLLVTVGYAVLDLDAIGSRGRMMAAIAIAGYIVVNGVGTRRVASAIGRVNLDPSRYLTVLSDFVDAHKAEPDFSFAVSRRSQTVDPEIVLVEGYPDMSSAPARVSTFSEILFAPYYDEEKPRYIIRGR